MRSFLSLRRTLAFLIILALLAGFFPPIKTAQATSVTLDSIADSYLQSGQRDANNGTAIIMDINDARDGIVRFDLSSIPAGSVISSATLNLVITAINGTNSRNYSVHR